MSRNYDKLNNILKKRIVSKEDIPYDNTLIETIQHKPMKTSIFKQWSNSISFAPKN